MADGIQRLVVVGGSLAGLRAAEAARQAGFTGDITVVSAEEEHPYDRPALSKQCLLEGVEAPTLRDDDPATGLGVTWLAGHGATGLDTSARQVVVGEQRVDYDALVIATGTRPRQLPGLPAAAGIVTLRDARDVPALRAGLGPGKRLTIIGAGIIGAEIATAARKLGAEVTLIEAAPVPLQRALGRHLGLLFSEWHGESGVDLRLGASVQAVQADNGAVARVVLGDGSVIPTDTLLVSIGVVPNTEWLVGSGVELAGDGSVLCDEFLETSVPGVFAAGDVISWPNAHTGLTARLETWTSANEQGSAAGENAVVRVEDRQPYSTVPYFWSDWYGHRIQFTGVVTDREPEVVFGSVESRKWVALFEDGGRVVGALAVNEPSKIMKDRRRIREGMSWEEAREIYRALSARVAVGAS
ncbi:NAD(P)/FAD-dependent oxidoreductase [Microbacterium sp. B19]|uniref:NAD(P)/FAD-dependent oxidoreductase n=1 Tax=Microbacterium sp. B19 TaxID=96765 RepID=UPI0003B68C17|nr:FAD-dependent oxidoreductase [Microbacterium sp. B19]